MVSSFPVKHLENVSTFTLYTVSSFTLYTGFHIITVFPWEKNSVHNIYHCITIFWNTRCYLVFFTTELSYVSYLSVSKGISNFRGIMRKMYQNHIIYFKFLSNFRKLLGSHDYYYLLWLVFHLELKCFFSTCCLFCQCSSFCSSLNFPSKIFWIIYFSSNIYSIANY